MSTGILKHWTAVDVDTETETSRMHLEHVYLPQLKPAAKTPRPCKNVKSGGVLYLRNW